MQSFTHRWNGEEYTVTVALCPDGFVDGATRAAVAHAFAGIINYRDVLGDARNADELFDLITEIRDARGSVVSRPWPTWSRGIDAAALDELAGFFFSDLQQKGLQSKSFKATTRLMKMTDLICATLTLSRGHSSPDPRTSPDSPARSTP